MLALGGSQGDIASLKGEDVDWTNNTVGFTRKKSGVPVLVHLGADALNVFKDLPAEGAVSLSVPRAGRETGRRSLGNDAANLASPALRCTATVTLGRNAPRPCGYPERFAQEALGHNSKAVHRAYAKRALMKIPSLEDYERKPEGAAIPMAKAG